MLEAWSFCTCCSEVFGLLSGVNLMTQQECGVDLDFIDLLVLQSGIVLWRRAGFWTCSSLYTYKHLLIHIQHIVCIKNDTLEGFGSFVCWAPATNICMHSITIFHWDCPPGRSHFNFYLWKQYSYIYTYTTCISTEYSTVFAAFLNKTFLTIFFFLQAILKCNI